MAGTFNFHLIDKIAHFRGQVNPKRDWWGRLVLQLRTHMNKVNAKAKQFDEMEVWWCPDGYVPAMLDTDVAVYIVPDVKNSVIAANGGDVSLAISDPNLLGLTATVLNICEIYYDREPYANEKVIAGAAFHEAAHLKSQMGNEMHSGKDGFLVAKPDYYGSPTDKNISFMAGIIGNKVKQSSNLKANKW